VSDRWLAKVRRYGGGESVVLSGSQDVCERLVRTYNEDYQTDTYWAEPWEEEKLNWPDLRDPKWSAILEEVKGQRKEA
jgi:hypothetical protein